MKGLEYLLNLIATDFIEEYLIDICLCYTAFQHLMATP